MAQRKKKVADAVTAKFRGDLDSEFVLKFDGKPNEISAATFLESLSGITGVLQEENRQFGTGAPVDIKIKAPEPGSFLVHLILDPAVEAHVANMFSIGGGLITGLATIIGIWKFLRGKPPKKVEEIPQTGTVSIQNDAGQVLIEDQKITNFVINNSNVTFNLARTFSALDADPNVTALEMLDAEKKKTLVEVPRDDFAELSVSPPPTGTQKRDIEVRARVTIVKPSFERKLRWELVWNGGKIGATVTDPLFNQSIDDGEQFSKGDSLDVTLRIKQEFDAALKTYLNKAHEVVKVHSHTRGPRQSDLTFPSSLPS